MILQSNWYMGMDQYLLIPFLGGWTSIYQLFWCSPGVQGFDTLPYGKIMENQWNGWKIYGTWPNMATYFPGSIGLVAYLVEFGRPGKDMCFFWEKRKVTSINTSLILPHWKIHGWFSIWTDFLVHCSFSNRYNQSMSERGVPKQLLILHQFAYHLHRDTGCLGWIPISTKT